MLPQAYCRGSSFSVKNTENNNKEESDNENENTELRKGIKIQDATDRIYAGLIVVGKISEQNLLKKT